MPFVTHVSEFDIQLGRHADVTKGKSLLIQITNPGLPFVNPKHQFDTVAQFWFYDIDAANPEPPPAILSRGLSLKQAEELVALITNAYKSRTNVVICSGAGGVRGNTVVQLAKLIGFINTDKGRAINKSMLNTLIVLLAERF